MRRLFLTLFALPLLSVTAFGQSDGGGRLVGTWNAVVTARNCDTGAAITTFQTVDSFNQGGTFSGISAGRPPTLRTPELGAWTHVSANLYRFRWKAYLFNSSGQATGYQIVTQDVELDHEALNWASNGTSEAFSLEGVSLGVACSTTVATRMMVDQ